MSSVDVYNLGQIRSFSGLDVAVGNIGLVLIQNHPECELLLKATLSRYPGK